MTDDSRSVTSNEIATRARAYREKRGHWGTHAEALCAEVERQQSLLQAAYRAGTEVAAERDRMRAALEKERQRYMSLADLKAKRGKDEAAQEFWEKAEAIEKVLKSGDSSVVETKAYRHKDCICEHPCDLTIPGGHHNRACPLRDSRRYAQETTVLPTSHRPTCEGGTGGPCTQPDCEKCWDDEGRAVNGKGDV